MNTEKLTILYDTLRDGRYKVDIMSPSQRYRHENCIDLMNEGYLKNSSVKVFHETFKLTAKGRKFIKDYDKSVRNEDALPYYITGLSLLRK